MFTKIANALQRKLYKEFIHEYDNMDAAHGRPHIDNVLVNVQRLGAKELSSDRDRDLAYTSGLLHDIGLKVNREEHEIHGAKFVNASKVLPRHFSKKEIATIADAVQNHRASTGNPSSIIAKIISDADRVDTNPLQRSYEYQRSALKYPHKTAIPSAAKHMTGKYDKGGTGRKHFFPETEQLFKERYDPFINAYKKKDWKALNAMVKET